MKDIKLNKLEEYKYVYEQTNKKRELLSNKLTSIITIYTGSVTGIIWIFLKLLKNYKLYHTIQKTTIIILLLVSSIISIIELCICIYIYSKYKNTYVSAREILNTFKEYSTKELKLSYSKERLRLEIYKTLCSGYIEAAITNEELLNYIAPKQKNLFVSILINLLLVATNFCIVTIIF